MLAIAAAACTLGFASVSAEPVGSDLHFSPRRVEEQPFDVDVFQQSDGRRVVRDALRARFPQRDESFTWSTEDQDLTDGYYFVRYSMKLAEGGRDTRRLTFLRKDGVFQQEPRFSQPTKCGTFSSFRLSSSVFGGPSGKSLRIGYRLRGAARPILVTVRAGGQRIRVFRGTGRSERFYLRAAKAAPGQQVEVKAAGRSVFARRL
jgi:hypothetical protein